MICFQPRFLKKYFVDQSLQINIDQKLGKELFFQLDEKIKVTN